jgi:hypothetical protein
MGVLSIVSLWPIILMGCAVDWARQHVLQLLRMASLAPVGF